MYRLLMRTIACLLLISVFSGLDVRAAGSFLVSEKTNRDTLRVKAGMIVILRDSFYVATADTILIPGREKIRIRKDPYAHSKSFYDSLAVHAGRKKLISALYKVFIRDNAPVKTVEKNSRSREDELSEANGKTIRSIRTMNVPLLDGDVRDTAWITRSIPGRLMSFHPQTRKNLILTSALPQAGERTDGESLADAERLIRAMPGIRDVELYVVPSEHSDSIDVVIVTQDLFPLRAGLNIRSSGRITGSFADNNLDGRALELAGRVDYLADAAQLADYRFTLRKSNLLGRYGELKAEALRTGSRSEQYVSYDRGFLTEDLLHLGGGRIGFIHDKVNSTDVSSSYERLQTGGWYGHVFKSHREWSFIPAVSVDNFVMVRMSDDDNLPFNLRDRITIAGNINLIRREFIRTALVTRFGVSEYFPVGESVQLTAGRQITEEFGRNYFSATGSFARFLNDAGFFGVTGSYGVFYRTTAPEDISLNAALDYFSPLLKWGRVRFRQFASIRYRSLTEQQFLSSISVENVRADAISVQEQVNNYMIYRLETIWHMPWFVYGFRFALFNGFEAYDVQLANGRKWFPVFSTGVRLRNEYLVYSTLSLQVKWQPGKYGLAEIISLKFTAALPAVFNGLGIGRPTVPD